MESLIFVGATGLILMVVAGVLFFKTRTADFTVETDGALSNALLFKQKGDLVQAQIHLERALSYLNDSTSPDSAKMSSCLIHLAECYEKQQMYKEARDCRDRLIKLWTNMLSSGGTAGLVDIDYAMSISNFGAGTFDIAQFYEKVIQLKERLYGPEHREVSNSLLILGRVYSQLGEKERADALMQRAQQIQDGTSPTPADTEIES